MAETLGSLCDKLTIVKLKEFHTEDKIRLSSLKLQSEQLQEEIDDYFLDALNGKISIERLSFSPNKVYDSNKINLQQINGGFGDVIARLAKTNCEVWHEQEKVFDFENVPEDQKDIVIKKLAELNLDRNNCIHEIDKKLTDIVLNKKNG